MKTKWPLCLLITLALLLAIPIVNCAPGTPPAPAPSHPPIVDEPSFSEDEAAAYIWSRLPSKLPGGYEKSQFSADTKMATYEGDGKWEFVVFGGIRDVTILPPEIYKDFKLSQELREEIWFEEQNQKVTTAKLMLTAMFYEKTRTVELVDVAKYDVQVNVETISKTTIIKELMVHWVRVEYSGYRYRFEGSVENSGKIPLTGVQAEIKTYDPDGNLTKTLIIPLYPETIAPGEFAHFLESVYLKGMIIRTYTYKFISDSVEDILYYPKDE